MKGPKLSKMEVSFLAKLSTERKLSSHSVLPDNAGLLCRQCHK